MNQALKQELDYLHLGSAGIPRESVVVANGHIEHISQVTYLPYLSRTALEILPVRYLPTLTTKLLLGMDFITRSKMVIDTSSQTWWYLGNPSHVYKFLFSDSPTPPSECCGIVQLNAPQRDELESVVSKARVLEPKGIGSCPHSGRSSQRDASNHPIC
uniref:Uncharacterized protein n=1 Tax=Cacopsylla melanoneura TaxID=428564 RepID=A0A8D8UDU0_9HEMI